LALTGQDYIIDAAGIGSASAALNRFAAFGAGDIANVSTLSQTFNTIAGATYSYSFDVGAFGGAQTFTYQIAGLAPTTVTVFGTNNLDRAFNPLSGTFVSAGLCPSRFRASQPAVSMVLSTMYRLLVQFQSLQLRQLCS
jgi:hypothetical protein